MTWTYCHLENKDRKPKIKNQNQYFYIWPVKSSGVSSSKQKRVETKRYKYIILPFIITLQISFYVVFSEGFDYRYFK